MNKEPEPKRGRPHTSVDDLRDLSDFCQNWPTLSGKVKADSLADTGLEPDQVAVVQWLAKLADRICPTEDFTGLR